MFEFKLRQVLKRARYQLSHTSPNYLRHNPATGVDKPVAHLHKKNFFGIFWSVGHSFAYAAHLWFLRDALIRTLANAAVASGRATNLSTHPLNLAIHPPNLATLPPNYLRQDPAPGVDKPVAHPHKKNIFWVYLECVGHSFAYAAYLWFLRDV
jgi:hypothetical protein